MNKFLLRFLLFLIPFILVLSFYFTNDPFKVLYNYDNYYTDNIIPNRGFVSTETFLKNQGNIKYNSFILGSSRTGAFEVEEWKKHIASNAIPYKFDASSEYINGIFSKLELIDQSNGNIDNALLIFCTDATFCSNLTAEHLIIPDPIYQNISYFTFQISFLKAYLSEGYFIRIIDYSIFHTYRPYMRGYISKFKIPYKPIINEIDWPLEKEIAKDSISYYMKRKNLFNIEDTLQVLPLEPQIDSVEIATLKKIRKLFDNNKTNYRIVISPLYDKRKINKRDLEIIESVFGASNVYDYSGINDITTNKYNYYEKSHYRIRVGKRIMDDIYSDSVNHN